MFDGKFGKSEELSPNLRKILGPAQSKVIRIRPQPGARLKRIGKLLEHMANLPDTTELAKEVKGLVGPIKILVFTHALSEFRAHAGAALNADLPIDERLKAAGLAANAFLGLKEAAEFATAGGEQLHSLNIRAGLTALGLVEVAELFKPDATIGSELDDAAAQVEKDIPDAIRKAKGESFLG